MSASEFCYGVYQGPGGIGSSGWLDYINCRASPPTASSNTNWPPAGCPASPPPVPDLSWSNAGPLSFPSNLDGGYGTPLTQLQAYGIMSLVWVAENSEGNLDGVVPWYKAYSYIQNIGDGRGFTTNIVGFCSGTGDLLVFLQNLQKISPCHPLTKYIPDVRILSDNPALNGNLNGLKGLPQLVLAYGGGPNGDGPIDPAYVEATWKTLTTVGDSGYWGTAMDYSRKYFLSLPISKGQLYDIGLNAGIGGLDTVLRRVTTPPPTPATSGKDAEVKWLLNLQAEWIKYIAETPSINDGQLDRGLMWQHLVDPTKTQKNSKGQIGANNKVPILDFTFPISVNCYGSTLNIQAPKLASTSTVATPSATTRSVPASSSTSTIVSSRVTTTPASSTTVIASPTTTAVITSNCFTAWNPTAAANGYGGGSQVSNKGFNWVANWWTNQEPSVSTDGSWSKVGSCGGTVATSTLQPSTVKTTITSATIAKTSSTTASKNSTTSGNGVSNGASCGTFGMWACNNDCICNYTATAAGNILVWQCSKPDTSCVA
ncbi:chitosanase [Chytriomyces confervae]|uniref:Chitosanase n=1 Tax=Chytriomyces confervae TaxID=246404 RepID=A0A507FIN9_9FUNG|nr:hypothetical protein HDU80_007892 [Chytriomyces hyalinus]TPX76163.1 chitosanase [Chytriomyces confervae]